MDMRKIVGLNLKRYRLAAGLSQEELAQRSGLDRTYISGLERCRRNPTVIVLYELATVLGRDPRDLLDPEAGPG
jgi:transcriptional regulator with XRE-family HTH domain